MPAQTLLLALFTGALLTGCNTSGCTENRSALPLAGFYSSATGKSVVLDSLAIGGVGAPGDSLLLKAGRSAYNLYLPFRSDRSSTSFRFHYDYPSQGLDNPEFDDIVTFRYSSTPYFASEECGAYYIYTIEDVEYTTHLIDSVVVIDPVINNVELERIKVYFRIRQTDNEDNPDQGEDNPDQGEDNPDNGEDNPDNGGDNPDNGEDNTGGEATQAVTPQSFLQERRGER